MHTVDVGNSSVVVGAWQGGEVRLQRFSEPEAAAPMLSGRALAISVAPARLARLQAAVAQAGGGPIRVLEGVPLPLADPRLADTAGADRLAVAVAVHPGAAIVVDAGTAVTVDIVDGEGRYAGGFIAPGPAAALTGLAGAATALPQLSGEPVPLIPAPETLGALSAGAWGMAVGGVDRLVDEALAALGEAGEVALLATGGWGGAWARWSRHTAICVDEALVHRGILRWGEGRP